MNSVSALLVVGGMSLLWAVAGVIREIRAKLARRAADWLIPDGQAWTVRIAFALAIVARWVQPQTEMYFEARIARVQWRPAFWTGPDEALAELAADLRAEERVVDPVRLILPVVRMAVRARLLWALPMLAATAFLWACMPILRSVEFYRWMRRLGSKPERPTDAD